MAKCDEGYLCDVCGSAVDTLVESDLCLRYVLGEVSEEQLPNFPERHLTCNPAVAQFIVDERFSPVSVEGPFCKMELDPQNRAELETRTTAAWVVLHDVQQSGAPLAGIDVKQMLTEQIQSSSNL